MFLDLIKWCQIKGYQYEYCRNWCSCVDYTDYINISMNDKKHLTVYLHTNGLYSCNYYVGKDLIHSWVNFYTAQELIKLVEGVEL